MQTCKWKIETTNLESTITSTVYEHLEVLQQNFGVYFPEDNYLSLNSLLWIVQPFTKEDFDLDYLTNKLIELRSDLVKKAELKTLTNYTYFWVSLLSNLEYQTLAQKVMSVLVRMPSTYHCKQKFSFLVEIKLKKRNSIKDVDTLMRGELEIQLPYILPNKPRSIFSSENEGFYILPSNKPKWKNYVQLPYTCFKMTSFSLHLFLFYSL